MRSELGARVGAADQRAHARLQLGELERLGEVVVGAEVQARDPVLDRIAHGEDQHRHAGAARAQALQHLEAVHLGQSQVEQHQVELVRGEARSASWPLAARCTLCEDWSRARSTACGEHVVVLDQEDPHGRYLLRLRRQTVGGLPKVRLKIAENALADS